jgi:hypothetical protein
MTKIRREDYTFVTNNRTDFTALYAKEELHAGLVIILPNVTPSRQRELFRAALSVVALSVTGYKSFAPFAGLM